MEIQTHGEQTERGWKDVDGFLGPIEPGNGPRRDPVGEFPTGPVIGERLPDLVASDYRGNAVDVHRDRADRPAVVNFFRSAVW